MTEQTPIYKWKYCYCPNCGSHCDAQFFPAKRAVASYCECCKEYYQIENVTRYTIDPKGWAEEQEEKRTEDMKITPMG